jgi:hypothetical protein
MVCKCDQTTTSASLNESKQLAIIMILGNLDIFLSVFYDFFGKIVVKTGKEVECHNKPTSRFTWLFKLTNSALNQLFFQFMQFFARIKRVCLNTKLLAHSFAICANSSCQKYEVWLDLAMNSLLIAIFLLEDELWIIAKIFHIIKKSLKVETNVFFQGIQQANICLFQRLLWNFY